MIKRPGKKSTVWGGKHDAARDLRREIDAINLGETIDTIFASECYRLGLDPKSALSAPLLLLALAMIEASGDTRH